MPFSQNGTKQLPTSTKASPVRQLLQDVGAHSRPGSSRDGVREHEALERVASVGLAVDDVENFFVELLALRESGSPVVAGATAVLGQEDVLLKKILTLFNTLSLLLEHIFIIS